MQNPLSKASNSESAPISQPRLEYLAHRFRVEFSSVFDSLSDKHWEVSHVTYTLGIKEGDQHTRPNSLKQVKTISLQYVNASKEFKKLYFDPAIFHPQEVRDFKNLVEEFITLRNKHQIFQSELKANPVASPEALWERAETIYELLAKQGLNRF